MTGEKQNKLVASILTIVLGVLFLILKAEVISIGMTVAGVAFIVMAVLSLIRRNVVSAIIEGVIAVLIIVAGWLFVSISLYIMAAVLLVSGIVSLFEYSKTLSDGRKLLAKLLGIVVPVLTILIGGCLLFNQSGTIVWVFIVVGISFIIDGALGLLELLGLKK